jgi:hypothetical protein
MLDAPSSVRSVRGFAGLVLLGAALQLGVARADSGTTGVEDVSIDTGFGKYTAKHLELTGANMAGAEFKALLAGIAKPGAADSLAKFDAASIVIPDLELDQDLGGLHQVAHYKDVKLTDIRAGKVGSYSIESATIDGGHGNGQTVSGVMHRMGGTDIDLPGLVRVFTQTGADASAPLQPLYGTAFGDGYEIKSPLFTMSAGKVTMSGISGRPLKTPLSQMFAKFPKPPKPGAPPSPEDAKAAMEMLPALFDIYGAFAFAKTEMHDLKFVTNGDPAIGAPMVNVSLASVSMTDYGNSKVGAMSIEGLDVTPPTGKFHLGKFALKGFDFREFIQSTLALMQKEAARPAGSPPDPEAFKLMKPPRLDELSIADLSADFMAPANPGDPEAQPQPVQFSLASFLTRPELWADGLPKSLLVQLDHLIVKVPPNVPNADVLAAAGFDKIDLSSKFDVQWDEKTQRLTVNTLSASGKDLGGVTIAATLDNIPPEAFNGDQFTRQAAMLGALLKAYDTRIENQKLYDIIFATQAKQTGKSADEVKSDLITAASVGIPQILGGSPNAKALGDAIAKFLANPKNLHVAFTSKDGLGAADMAAPNLIMDKVELTAKANE